MTEQVPRNPYPGLRPFEQDDSEFFFGREAHTLELLRKLDSSRFVAVIGTSGSGKSSLVRAGLIPALYGDTLGDTGSHWRVAILRPGDNPFKALGDELHEKLPVGTVPVELQFRRGMLETTLRRSSLGLIEAVAQAGMREKEHLLVVVDQFEEIFRFHDAPSSAESSDERAAFVKLLLEGAASKDARIYVLITMRSDFLGDCARFRKLPEAINYGLYLIPRLTRDQLREAIVGPMAVSGGTISPALVERLLNDIGDDQDQLPVLQHALMRTWLPKREITLDDYKTKGGMETALSNHANEAIADLPSEKRDVARKVFQCITAKGLDNREVRRPTRFEDILRITGASETDVRAVVESFRVPGRSFLMPPYPEPIIAETRIDISHESLIRKWDMLREWADAEAESADWYRRLAESARLHKKGQSGLWGDPALQFALEKREKAAWNPDWGRRYGENYSDAINFLEESKKNRDADLAEHEAQRKTQLKRARVLAVVSALALFLAIFVGAYVLRQRNLANEKEQFSRRLLYVANMNLAGLESADSNIARSHELLNEFLPISSQDNREDLRNFCWYYLWRVNHQEFATLKGHGKFVRSVAFSPDGKTLATGSNDDTTKLWDMATRQEITTLKGHGNSVSSVAFSPDGKTLATGSDDNTTKLWDVATRQEITTLKGHGNSVFSVAFSPDGKTLATGSDDNTTKLWDVATRQEITTLKGHGNSVSSVAFSPDGKTLATGSDDNTTKLWDVATRQEITTLKGHGNSVFSVAFSPDGKTLVTGSRDSTIKLWDVATRQEITPLNRHGNSIFSVAFSPDGKTLATGSADSTIKLWDMAMRREITTLKGHGDPIFSVAFSPDGKTLATGGWDNTVKLWDVATRQEITILEGHGNSVSSVAFSPDGKTLATGGWDDTVKLWDAATRQEIITLKGHGNSVFSVAFSPDGKTLATGSADSTIKLWDVVTRQEITTLKGHGNSVSSVAFSPDGMILATGSADSTIKLWDVVTRQEITTLKGHGNSVFSVAFSPDGKTLATGGWDDTIKLWDVATRQETITLKGQHGNFVRSVSFSPDGKTLATGSQNSTIELWDVGTRRKLVTLKGHGNTVFSVAFSPDGKTLATGSADRTTKLWDMITRRELVTLTGHVRGVSSLAFAPDGKALATGGEDSTIRLWIAATDDKVAAQRP